MLKKRFDFITPERGCPVIAPWQADLDAEYVHAKPTLLVAAPRGQMSDYSKGFMTKDFELNLRDNEEEIKIPSVHIINKNSV